MTPPLQLDPFYLILDDADWIERLVPLGVRLVQLRAKGMQESRLRLEIRRSLTVCRAHGCALVVNDHWRLAIEEGADIVHLGQEDLAAADVGAIRRADLRLGVSTHDRRELEMALRVEPNYVALGPIWPTILKAMSWAPQTPERLREWRTRIGDLPLVAIGGLNPDERLRAVLENGADSAAVVTDITRNPDPEARTREWIHATATQRERPEEELRTT